MKISELEEKTLSDVLNSDVKFLDLTGKYDTIEKYFDSEHLEDLQEEKVRIDTWLSLKGVGNKVFLNCNSDWIMICENDEVKEIFNVYDLENFDYDEDIDSIIARGHETLHRYIVSSGKYKVTQTR